MITTIRVSFYFSSAKSMRVTTTERPNFAMNDYANLAGLILNEALIIKTSFPSISPHDIMPQ